MTNVNAKRKPRPGTMRYDLAAYINSKYGLGFARLNEMFEADATNAEVAREFGREREAIRIWRILWEKQYGQKRES